MSALTPGAKSLLEAEERLKTDNGATNWLIDQIAGSVQSDGRGGTKTTGGWGWIGDRLGLDSTEIRERRASTEQHRAVDSAIGKTGRTREDLTTALGRTISTEDDVAAAGVKLVEGKQKKEKDDTRTQIVEDRDAGFKQANETLAATIAAGDRRANQTAKLSLAQMQLGQLQANNQFEIAQMNNRLQMRREDAKEARLDRKDRQAAIQQMMAGLAQMGASIAI